MVLSTQLWCSCKETSSVLVWGKKKKKKSKSAGKAALVDGFLFVCVCVKCLNLLMEVSSGDNKGLEFCYRAWCLPPFVKAV